MKDRYLFKAKTCNGEWVTGFLHCKDDKWYISNKAGSPFAYEVRPDTICQCTGLKDRNGNLIWEHDIMVANLDESCPDDKTYQKVIWNESGFHSKEKGSEDIYPIGRLEQECFEVVGNIFDNPELLESEE
jgi:uncharacterized phage protein (TIGR01671 family)